MQINTGRIIPDKEWIFLSFALIDQKPVGERARAGNTPNDKGHEWTLEFHEN